MTVIDIINEFNQLFPEVDKNPKARDREIEKFEQINGIKLPLSYKKFLKFFSNGIILLDVEPVMSVGIYINSNCGLVIRSNEIIQADDEECLIVSENRKVLRKNLFAFTAGC